MVSSQLRRPDRNTLKPLHNVVLRADIVYVLTEVQTQYGIIGVKVWICNGESARK